MTVRLSPPSVSPLLSQSATVSAQQFRFSPEDHDRIHLHERAVISHIVDHAGLPFVSAQANDDPCRDARVGRRPIPGMRGARLHVARGPIDGGGRTKRRHSRRRMGPQRDSHPGRRVRQRTRRSRRQATCLRGGRAGRERPGHCHRPFHPQPRELVGELPDQRAAAKRPGSRTPTMAASPSAASAGRFASTRPTAACA